MKIYFRVDSSYRIGTGHVMRCLTLADELKICGANIEFICRETEGNILSVIEERGYKINALPKSTSKNDEYCHHYYWLEANWQDDAEQTENVIAGADWLIIDHYAIDEKWEKSLRTVANKIAVIDDLADRNHDCDLLLDQNYYQNFETRYAGVLPSYTLQLLGPQYSLLRPEFANARAKIKPRGNQVKKIFIFFGGVDANNDTEKALKALKNFDGIITVVAGGSNRNYERLEKYCSDKTNITLLKTADNMAELMAAAHVAIGSGGSTTWERASLGLPTLAWPIGDNQIPILNDLNELGALKLSSPQNLMNDLANTNFSEMSKKAAALVDGKGAGKVASYITYDLRPALPKDSQRIWELRNEEEVRANSTSTEIIPIENHDKWYKLALANPNRELLVLADQNDIGGVLRYDVNGQEAEVSIYLNTQYFGRGLGAHLLERGEAYIKRIQPQVTVLTATIMDHNLKSQNLFAKLGFVQEGELWIKNI